MPDHDTSDVLSRTAPPPDASLRYGEHPDQVADLRLPGGSSRAPLVVVLHGGFWRAAYDRAHAGPQSAGFTAAGWAVATVEYRRVGAGGGVPTTFDDVATAVGVVPALAAAHAPGRVDADRVVLVGHSAGAHLALWASARHRLPVAARWQAPRDAALRGVVSLGGVTDLARAVREGLGAGAASALLEAVPTSGLDPSWLDPARLGPTGVPTVLLHGEDDADVPADYSRQHARRLAAAGSPARLEVLQRTGHYELIDPLSDAWPRVVAAVAQLLGRG